MERNESLFYDRLKDIFIGGRIEGNSGFVNLMRIKSSYFDVVFTEIRKEIDEKTEEFPDFKEEIYDKLSTFFQHYFSESGSIYFAYTPLKSKIHDRIYTTQEDVVLFWKTRMLYYVKTDKIWSSLNIEYKKDGIIYKINFDVSKLEQKSGNEKKEIIFELKEINGERISFYVVYSQRGRKTDVSAILNGFKDSSIHLDDEDLDNIFSIFERQNEVDYFINKDAKSFLKEQFDIWLKNYLFDDESDFSDKRLRELKLLKEIAYEIIDFVSQFEDELVKIWEKPKFVLNSNYVITLDRIADRQGGMNVIREILNHRGIYEQIEEWKDLGIVDDSFEVNSVLIRSLTGETINEDFRFLPIDTKYFKDLELDILSLFENLDEELDGHLIHSENYQALGTILPKYKEKVQTIYIDPPFNKEQNADYPYEVKYKDSTWITLLENRVNIARHFLKDTGSIFVRCDYNGNMYVRLLMNDIFGWDKFRNELIINRTRAKQLVESRFGQQTESLFFYSKSENLLLNEVERPKEPEWHPLLHFPRADKRPRVVLGREFYPPKGRRWALSQKRISDFEKAHKIRINEDLTYEDCRGKVIRGVPELLYDTEIVGNEWLDIPGYSQAQHFPTENSEALLKRVIESTSGEGDLVMDFFLGSGTTIAVAHKLHRNWIGVEMGDHFYDVILPRMKKVLAYDKSGISGERDIQEIYNRNKAGGFFKYYDLEQYEQTLRKCRYVPGEPFFNLDDKSIYGQYIFMKDPNLLDSMELDYHNNRIKVNFNDIYPDTDIAETLSNIKGKWIRRIAENSVVLIDDKGNEEEIKFDDIDFKTIKPLIWWQ